MPLLQKKSSIRLSYIPSSRSLEIINSFKYTDRLLKGECCAIIDRCFFYKKVYLVVQWWNIVHAVIVQHMRRGSIWNESIVHEKWRNLQYRILGLSTVFFNQDEQYVLTSTNYPLCNISNSCPGMSFVANCNESLSGKHLRGVVICQRVCVECIVAVLCSGWILFAMWDLQYPLYIQ